MSYILDFENPGMEPNQYYWPKVHLINENTSPALIRRARAEISVATTHETKENVLAHFDALADRPERSRQRESLIKQLALLP